MKRFLAVPSPGTCHTEKAMSCSPRGLPTAAFRSGKRASPPTHVFPLQPLTGFLLQQKTTGMDIIAAASSFLSCPVVETKTPRDGRYDDVSV
ncbi:hypothetical protein F2P81_021874 [Scophthalmus maximus]|uniref:Uncharacterized protein n=1 Tax=Scophthalmus maximus TaxID=52904 RepID=A0A6A4RSK0_SCOMX|nr:hypothetical protein F2P81_021874 [Scophthalmus maximus]